MKKHCLSVVVVNAVGVHEGVCRGMTGLADACGWLCLSQHVSVHVPVEDVSALPWAGITRMAAEDKSPRL